MHYAVMYRSPGGDNTKLKSIYRSIDDAEDGVLDTLPWLSEDAISRTSDGSTFYLNDGSCFVIFREG